MDKSTIALLVGIAFFVLCIVAVVLRSRRLARYEREAREHNNESVMERPVITAVEAAERKGVSRQAIMKALGTGKLNGYRSASAWLVRVDSAFDAYRAEGGHAA